MAGVALGATFTDGGVRGDGFGLGLGFGFRVIACSRAALRCS